MPDKPAEELPPAALWLTLSVAERAPAALGVKPTTIVQLAPGTMLALAVQVPPLTENSVLAVVMPDSTSGALPVLPTVSVCVAVAVPTVEEPKFKVVGVNCATGALMTTAVPVPDKPTVALPPDALWLTVSVAERAPAALGVNVTLIAQLEVGARLELAVQLPPLTTNSVLPVLIADRFSDAVPVLVTVTFRLPVAVPIVEVPKDSAVGATVAPGVVTTTATPVPDKPTVALPPAALWLTVSVAERAPAALGVKVKLMVQLPFGAMLLLALHVPPLTANSALAVEIPESSIAAVPVLLTVTVCAGEAAVPTVAEPKLRLVGLI